MSGDLANLVDLLGTVGAELNLGGEEVDTLVLVVGALDEGGLDHTLLTLGGAEEGLGEASTGHGHGESGGSSTVLGLDDLVTTELDAVDELIAGSAVNAGVVGLGEERDNSDTRVTTDDGDVLVAGVGLLDLRDEARGTDNVKGGDTEETLGVVDTLGLVDLGDDGDRRVDLDANQRKSTLRKSRQEHTGLEMTRTLALGEASAAALARSRTMEALVLKRSSRVMPGLRGTPAGMRTISAPLRASFRPEPSGVGLWPETTLLVLMWPRSAATPISVSQYCFALCLRARGQQTYQGHRGYRRGRARKHGG